MTNGSLPRDKKCQTLITKEYSETSDTLPTLKVVQSPRTKIRTTCNYSVNNKPPVPVRKPLLFANSGKNPLYYQYYNLQPQQQVNEDLQSSSEDSPNFFEYHSQMLLLSSLKRQLEDLKAKEVEEKSEEELERSLLNAEFDHINANLAELRARLADLRTRYAQMNAGKHDFNLDLIQRNLRESNAKIQFITSCLQR